jgi:hypothetical protein
LELDELWGFCYAKQKNVPAGEAGVFGYGDVWTFIAIDADTSSARPSCECIGCKKQVIQGRPDYKLVSTSYIERQNLTVRMIMRRFTRLTNAFSKKVENLAAAVAIHFMHYNFCRPHMSLKGRTPAQAAGVTSRRWMVENMIRLLGEIQSPETDPLPASRSLRAMSRREATIFDLPRLTGRAAGDLDRCRRRRTLGAACRSLVKANSRLARFAIGSPGHLPIWLLGSKAAGITHPFKTFAKEVVALYGFDLIVVNFEITTKGCSTCVISSAFRLLSSADSISSNRMKASSVDDQSSKPGSGRPRCRAWRGEDFADLAGQLLGEEGLGEEGGAAGR